MVNPKPQIKICKKRDHIDFLNHSIGIFSTTVDKLIYMVHNSEGYKTSNVSFTDKHVIYCFLYFKQYLTMDEIARTLQISTRTFATYYVEGINMLYKAIKDKMDQRYEEIYEKMDFIQHPNTNKVYKSIAIDSTSVQIQRPTDSNVQKLYFQDKKKIHCAKFHVEVSTKTKRLLYVSKIYKGAIHDKKIGDCEYQILDENGIQKVDENGKLMYKHSTLPFIGDKAYVGAEYAVSPYKKKTPFTLEQSIHNNFVSSNRIFIENFFLEVKSFNILDQVYRGNLDQLEKIFLIICFVCDLENKLLDGFDIEFDQEQLNKIKENRKITIL